MAHEIEIQNGVASAFFVGEVPWHRQGTVLPEGTNLTDEEGYRLARMNWEVKLQPVHMTVEGQDILIPSHHAVVRADTNAVLSIMGKGYTPFQNRDAFKFFQPFLDSGAASLEAAGVLRGGKRVWVLAKINRDPVEIVKGDALVRYALLSNSHDGGLAIRAGFTNVRAVCANTIAEAHSSASSKLLRVRHTKNAVRALGEIQSIMDLSNREFLAEAEQLRSLARKGVSVSDLKEYVRKVFTPKVTVGQLTSEAEPEENERLLAKIIPLFEKGRGNDLPGVAGTMWGAYNAVNEYLQYERGREENRLDSMWFGDSARVNQRALQVAMQMTA